ncbi:hypothetical protein C1645_784852 [Glomus cerebriforme]|uniref:Uncharacterized protein n=1 Tax=Glomus cerebriforme TaxID=658196 RepID=A0A397SDM1_9GLOM|nr:hypothetical protein C1645_784852 [Glomus cerebriforme]
MTGDEPKKVLDQEKQKILKGKVKSSIETAPGWNEKLASESEATVKADRHGDSVTIEELQRQSISLMEEHDYEIERKDQ